MRLAELHVDGFGHFRDHVVGPLDGNVTVLRGPNEAGKSTLLAFIRTVLFGFPSRGRDDHYPPLAGGRHGGRITLVGDDGETYTLERYAGPRGGHPMLRAESGEQAALEGLIGHATLSLYSNVFAFSLDEMQSEGLMSDSEVSGRLYSVGMGASGLPEFRAKLADRRDGLFRPRGSAQKIPRLLQELNDVDGRLRTIQGSADEYRRLTDRQEVIQRELGRADDQMSKLNARLSKAKRLLDGWDDWVVLEGLETQLRELPEIERFPESPIERLEAAEHRIRQATEDRDEAKEEYRRLSELSETDIPGEKLLEDREEVERVRRSRSSYDDSVRDLPERQAEVTAEQTNLNRQLRDLGQDWDEDRLDGFDTSMVFRQEVDGFRVRLAELSARARSSAEQLARERSALVERQATVEETQAHVPDEEPALDSPEIDRRRSALRTARSRLNDHERASLNLENLRAQHASLSGSGESVGSRPGIPPLLLPILLAVAGITLLLAGALLGQESLLIGLVAGLALLGASAYLLARIRRVSMTDKNPMTDSVARGVRDAEAAQRSTGNILLESVKPLELDTLPTADVLDNVEAQLDAATRALSTWNEANRRSEEAKLALEAQQRRVDQADEQKTSVVESEAAARDEWREWLVRRELDGGLTPDGVVEFTGRIATNREVLTGLGRMRQRVAAIEVDIDEYGELVRPLAERHDIPFGDAAHQQVMAAADTLIERLEDVRARVSEREQVRQQAEQQQHRLDQLERRLKSAEEELVALLEAGGAGATEEFRNRAAIFANRQELEAQRAERLAGLSRLSGPDARLKAFRDSLSDSNPDLLRNEAEALSQQLETLNAQRDELNQEQGANEAAITRMAGEEESSELLMRRNILMEQLEEDAREWSRLTIAGLILERTQRKFERERQPGVIRHAEESFSMVTGKRYTRLFAPVGEQTITVTTASGQNRRPAELSRGTREQLYLALRFGLIREFGEHAERLPVVVDEALVNFDAERASLATGAFAALSETNQVLVFTCHDAIADMFANVRAQVLDIGQSGV